MANGSLGNWNIFDSGRPALPPRVQSSRLCNEQSLLLFGTMARAFVASDANTSKLVLETEDLGVWCHKVVRLPGLFIFGALKYPLLQVAWPWGAPSSFFRDGVICGVLRQKVKEQAYEPLLAVQYVQ
jgi:hypothetical protein